ncbi:MAG TPA: hypothetical protein VH436_09830 [Vicinamibacterales bacterium]
MGRHDAGRRIWRFEVRAARSNYGLEHMLKVSRMLDKPGGK